MVTYLPYKEMTQFYKDYKIAHYPIITMGVDPKFFFPIFFKVHNFPSIYVYDKGGKLKDASGDAWLDSNYVGHFHVDSLIDIPANANFLIPVKLDVDMKYVLQFSLTGFKNEDVLVTVKGTAKAVPHRQSRVRQTFVRGPLDCLELHVALGRRQPFRQTAGPQTSATPL